MESFFKTLALVSLILFLGSIFYVVVIYYKKRKAEQKIREQPIASSIIEGQLKELEKLTAGKLGGFTPIEIWGIFFNLTIVFATITGLLHAASVDERVHRPYLHIASPSFELYNESGLLPSGLPLSDVKYFRIKQTTYNEGDVPAKRIEYIVESDPEFIMKKDNNRMLSERDAVIYKDSSTLSERIPIENLLEAIKQRDEFYIKVKITYRGVGSNKIYTAYNDSKCMHEIGFGSLHLGCERINAGTD